MATTFELFTDAKRCLLKMSLRSVLKILFLINSVFKCLNPQNKGMLTMHYFGDCDMHIYICRLKRSHDKLPDESIHSIKSDYSCSPECGNYN